MSDVVNVWTLLFMLQFYCSFSCSTLQSLLESVITDDQPNFTDTSPASLRQQINPVQHQKYQTPPLWLFYPAPLADTWHLLSWLLTALLLLLLFTSLHWLLHQVQSSDTRLQTGQLSSTFQPENPDSGLKSASLPLSSANTQSLVSSPHTERFSAQWSHIVGTIS